MQEVAGEFPLKKNESAYYENCLVSQIWGGSKSKSSQN